MVTDGCLMVIGCLLMPRGAVRVSCRSCGDIVVVCRLLPCPLPSNTRQLINCRPHANFSAACNKPVTTQFHLRCVTCLLRCVPEAPLPDGSSQFLLAPVSAFTPSSSR